MMNVKKINQWYHSTVDKYIALMKKERNPYQLPMFIFTTNAEDIIDFSLTGIDELTGEVKVISIVEFIKKGGLFMNRIKNVEHDFLAVVYWCHLYMIQKENYEKSLLITHLFHPLEKEIADARYFFVDWHDDIEELNIEEVDHAKSFMEINNPDVELLFKNPFT